jgi:CBS domain-containing protein/dienelactone hydrolase
MHMSPSVLDPAGVSIPVGDITLDGDLVVPEGARGIIVFAHGSGSSRHSPRNRFVAEVLQSRRHATLLLDLLTQEEERIDLRTREYRFDIERLGARLVAAIDWVRQQPATAQLSVGLFGASTGAAAALLAAAARPEVIDAVVSRGGRPDLAGPALRRVTSPTLLIVGGDDEPVIALNREAMANMRTETQLEIVPGATHLFEEPGTLEKVAALAADWFDRKFVDPVAPASGPAWARGGASHVRSLPPPGARERKHTMKVQDIMTREVRTCTTDTTLPQVAKAMWNAACGAMPVIDERGKVAGMITDRDISMALVSTARRPSQIPAREAMTRPPHGCGPDDSLQQALDAMKKFKVRRLPVLSREGLLMGMLSVDDIIVRALASDAPSSADIIAALRTICDYRALEPEPELVA